MAAARWWPVAWAMLAAAWGGNQFTPLLLMYRHEAGYSQVMVDIFLGSYVFGLVPVLLSAGRASDAWGRRPVLAAGTVLSLLGSVVLSLGEHSAAALVAGRLLSGAGLAVAMTVGTGWLRELAAPPFDAVSDAGAGPRRASLALTLGLGIGAGVAGALAQWGPAPMVLAYAVHAVIAAAGLSTLWRSPETAGARAPGARPAGPRGPVAGPAVPRRFAAIVLPMAPWVFGCAAMAYAVTPQLLAEQVGEWGLAFATALTVLTLGTGAGVAPLARRLDTPASGRAIVVAMAVVTTGVAAIAINAAVLSVPLGIGCAVLLGAGYGLAVVSGLQEVARMSTPAGMARLSGLYYSLTYLGFLAPAAMAGLAAWLSYPVMLTGLAVLAAGAMAVCWFHSTTGLSAVALASRRG